TEVPSGYLRAIIWRPSPVRQHYTETFSGSLVRKRKAERGKAMATPERHLRADARRNRERLVTVAREAFAEHGVEASLDDIARRAAVGPGRLYRHFPSREALLAVVYQGDVQAMAAQADELAERYPPGEALFAWLRLHLEYAKGKQGMGGAIKAMLA